MGKRDAFDITTYTYKTVKNHKFLTDVLIPKDIPTGPRPILIRLHGGFLVSPSNEISDLYLLIRLISKFYRLPVPDSKRNFLACGLAS